MTLQKAYNSWKMKYTGRSAQWGLFTWKIMASHKKRLDLEKLQKNHYSSPSYKYLTYFIHRSLPGWMFTTGDKTATGYHLDFTGSEKSRDKIGYHCLLCSDPHRKVITLFWNSTSKTCIKRTPSGTAVVLQGVCLIQVSIDITSYEVSITCHSNEQWKHLEYSQRLWQYTFALISLSKWTNWS